MKTIIVGDIHGCFAELTALLEKAGIGPGDRIVAVGDLLDRGPEPADVLRFFLDRPGTLSILGNQDHKHLQGKPGFIREITRRRCGEELYARGLAWLRERPLYLELDPVTIVHWGVEPGLPLAEQRADVLLGLPEGEEHLTRRCGGRTWYDAYTGRRPIVYGHHSFAAGIRRGLTFGIDTGCVYGQELTGLLLPEMETVSVPARADHWFELRINPPL
jgi:serine/threonine protein phosphatase 1